MQFNRFVLAVLCFACAGFVTRASAGMPPATLEEIADGHAQAQGAVDSLLAEYVLVTRPLVDRNAFKEEILSRDLKPNNILLVRKGPKLFYRRTTDIKYTEGIPDQTILYDGAVIKERRMKEAGADTLDIRSPKEGDGRYFPYNYFDHLLLGTDDPGLPTNAVQRSRLPYLLRERSFVVKPEKELVHGVPCVVAEVANRNKIFFDPQLNFAVRRQEVTFDGRLAKVVEYSNFTEVVAGVVWLPRKVEYSVIGRPDDSLSHYVSEAHWGKPVLLISLTVQRLEANLAAHDKYFTLNVDPGTIVLDTTRSPLDEAGRPVETGGTDSGGIVYVQPAKGADLEEVIRQTQQRYGTDYRAWQRQQFKRKLMIASAVLLGGVLLGFGFWKWRKRVATTAKG